MKAHLIKSKEVDTILFTKVVDLLQAVKGPIEFIYDEGSVVDFDTDEFYPKIYESETEFNRKNPIVVNYYSLNRMNFNIEFPYKTEIVKWEDLFKKCNKYRKQKNIQSNEFVLILTDTPNEYNWFASLDERMPFNGFIHTADWQRFISCPPEFPIAYEVIALMLQKHIFNSMHDVRLKSHSSSLGCVSDFCENKKEIIIKLRTADICHYCMEELKAKLSLSVVYHARQIMESLRMKMLYVQNFKQESPLSKLQITPKHKLFLPDFENVEIKLRPLEKALYLLFLDYPEGIYLSSLSNHRNELYDIYCSISNQGSLAEMKHRIDEMVNALSNSSSEKISRIKKVFEEAIGEELAKHYYIRGEHGNVKKIAIDRGMITY